MWVLVATRLIESIRRDRGSVCLGRAVIEGVDKSDGVCKIRIQSPDGEENFAGAGVKVARAQ